jgi:Putative auto-transporter adhesin, head GIN domain
MIRSTFPLFALALAISAPVLATEVVPIPEFRSVQLRGGGEVAVVPGPIQRVTILEGSSQFTRMYVDNDGQLRIDACNERCPREYRLRIEIQSPRVPNLAVAGGGQITTMGGFAPEGHLAVAVNGGGKIDARSVDASSVSAAVNGGGELLVRPRQSLAAAVNGGGTVRYWGHPSISMAVRGGGDVTAGY